MWVNFTHEKKADYNLTMEHSFMKYISQEWLTRNTWFCKEEATEMTRWYSRENLHNQNYNPNSSNK